MPKWLRISLKLIAGCCLLLVGLWIVLAAYVETHKKELLQRVTESLNDQLDGKISVGDISFSLWRGFPSLAVEMQNVSVRDTLWEKHHHSLLEAQDIYVNLNMRKLISKRIEIKKITASHGRIYLFTDSSGYSNTYIFKKKNPDKKGSKQKISFLDFSLNDIQFTLEHKIKNKLFRIDIHHFSGHAKREQNHWLTESVLDARISDFCFNTEKGSYLKDVNLKSSLRFRYYPDKKHLEIPEQSLQLNEEQLAFAGNFHFNETPAAFDLHFLSKNASFHKVIAWLSPNISCKLDSIDLVKPVRLEAFINGHIKYRDTPTVAVTWDVRNNTLRTPFDDFTNCTFQGKFYNEFIPGKGHNDPNSAIQLTGVKAEWLGLPFQIDTFHLSNLQKPIVNFYLQSLFPLTALNNAGDNMPFLFKNGFMAFKLHYNGTISAITGRDSTIPNVQGFITVRNANFVYLPRGLEMKNTSADLLLEGDNMRISNVVTSRGESVLKMEGTAEHIFRFYFSNPEKVLIAWRIKAPVVNLGDFITFVSKRKRIEARRRQQQAPRNKAHRILNQLDKVLDLANVVMDVDVDKLNFRHFTATNLKATANLSTQSITLQQIKLLHAGGSLNMNAVINQGEARNPFTLQAVVNDVDVSRMFYAFENFGQDAIDYKNVQGKLSVDVNVNGNMTDDAKIIPGSMNGTINYQLKDGAIVNFEPFTKINKFAFKKRDLSNVLIKDLSGHMTVAGNKFIIPPTQIVSSTFYLTIAGVYAPPYNTDISLELPLRNPQKDAADSEDPNSIVVPKKKKGLVLFLRAKSDKDGKVKIGLDRDRKIIIGKPRDVDTARQP